MNPEPSVDPKQPKPQPTNRESSNEPSKKSVESQIQEILALQKEANETLKELVKKEAPKELPKLPVTKRSWWQRRTEDERAAILFAGTIAGTIVAFFVGGAIYDTAHEASRRATLNSDGFKEQDKLRSEEFIAKVNRGLLDPPKTLEEASARVVEGHGLSEVVMFGNM